MIRLVTGKPGHGKSYYAVKRIVDALEAGQYVATNIDLVEGWEYEAARANPFRRHWPARVNATAQRFRDRSYVTSSLAELVRLRLPPCGVCKGCRAGRVCRKEGRGLMVLDESHEWLNARTWNKDDSGLGLDEANATTKRLRIVRFFARHRKYGWHIDLITQDEKRLDNQVRGNFEHHVHLKNLHAFKVPGLPFRIFPFNVFVAVTTWHDREASRVGVETFFLNKRVANLYESMALPDLVGVEEEGTILLGGHRPTAILEAGQPPPAGANGRESAAPAVALPAPQRAATMPARRYAP